MASRNNLFEVLTKLFEWASHLNFVGDIADIFKGKATRNEAHFVVKAMGGIFGLGDEITVSILSDQLEEERPGGREVITGFLAYQYAQDRGIIAKLFAWYISNHFREFLRKKHESSNDPPKTAKHKAVWEENGKKCTKEWETDIPNSKRDDPALLFLKDMVETIDPEERVGPDKPPVALDDPYLIEGYERLIRRFKAFGIPHVPKDIDEKIDALINAATTTVGKAAMRVNPYAHDAIAGRITASEAIARHKQQVRQGQSRLTRFLNWF